MKKNDEEMRFTVILFDCESGKSVTKMRTDNYVLALGVFYAMRKVADKSSRNLWGSLLDKRETIEEFGAPEEYDDDDYEEDTDTEDTISNSNPNPYIEYAVLKSERWY